MKNNISCNVIEDLLPLYVDEVLSDDSRELVEEHLSGCESCRDSAEKMGKTVVISNDTDGKNIKKLRRRFSVKKIVVFSLLSLVILFGLGFYLFYYGNAVSYNDVNVISGIYKDEDINYDGHSPTAYLGQGWAINFNLKSGKGLRVIQKEQYKTDEYGAKVYVGKIFELREVPINLFGDSDSFTFGQSYCVFTPDVPDNTDETVTVIYKDKAVNYSMKHEGLFEEQNPNKDFEYYMYYFKD